MNLSHRSTLNYLLDTDREVAFSLYTTIPYGFDVPDTMSADDVRRLVCGFEWLTGIFDYWVALHSQGPYTPSPTLPLGFTAYSPWLAQAQNNELPFRPSELEVLKLLSTKETS